MSSVESLKKIIKFSEELVQYNIENVDFNSIANNLLELSKAAYITFSINCCDEIDSKTVGIAGKMIKNYEATDFFPLEINYKKEKKGEFLIFFPSGEVLQEKEVLEMYALQIGAFLDRLTRERKLRHSEEKFKSYTDYSPFGMLIFDYKNNKITDTNNKALEMLKYTYNEIIGSSPEDFFISKTRKSLGGHFKRILSLGQDYMETEMIKKNGDVIFVGITGVKLSDFKIIGFFEDITEDKILDEELKHVNSIKKQKKYQNFFMVRRSKLEQLCQFFPQKVRKDFLQNYLKKPFKVYPLKMKLP